MAPKNHIDAGHTRREFQVDIHAIVRKQHHHHRTFAAHFVDDFLHLGFLDAEIPFRRQVARIGDRRIGKRLADNRNRHTVHFLHRVGRKHRVAKIGGLNILREKLHPALEVFLNDFFYALVAKRKFPMARHDVHAEFQRGIDHVLPLCPQRRRRALPCVATIEQQRAGTR